MGREIRKVPANWEHPKNERGHYQPLYDESFREAATTWTRGFLQWAPGFPEFDKHGTDAPFYWQWEGNPPQEDLYRPEWMEAERTHFQVYETVSEGTPVSPVLPSKDAVVAWAMEQGHSRANAEAFAEDGYVPSGMFVPGRGLVVGIDAAGIR